MGIDQSTPRALTSTSFAILGLLAVRPWSSYELTAQMRRSFDRFWPRAESKLYEEPKKLVAHGLAVQSEEHVGRRRRSVFTITGEGRDALSRWLTLPTAPPVLESEALLKVFLADHGSTDNLVSRLEELRDWAEQRADHDAAIARGYLDGTGEFADRLPLLTLVGGHSFEMAVSTARWAEAALATVRSWPSDPASAPVDRGRLERIANWRGRTSDTEPGSSR